MKREEMSDPTWSPDRVLARRVLDGDEDAFRELFERSFPSLFRFALARLEADFDAAEEVVQEVLCRAVTKLHTYRGEAALLTWLCTICRREIAAHVQRRDREARLVARLDDVPEIRFALESLAATEGAPEGILLRKELGELVRLTLDNLPPRYGAALEWKYLESLSVADIASRLEVGPKAAESLLTRARAAFREAFSILTGALGDAGGADSRVALGSWRSR